MSSNSLLRYAAGPYTGSKFPSGWSLVRSAHPFAPDETTRVIKRRRGPISDVRQTYQWCLNKFAYPISRDHRRRVRRFRQCQLAVLKSLETAKNARPLVGKEHAIPPVGFLFRGILFPSARLGLGLRNDITLAGQDPRKPPVMAVVVRQTF